MTTTIDSFESADVFDSRDVIERMQELSDQEARTEEEAAELAELEAFAAEGEGYADWQYGEAFIRDSYFREYAEELANDIGAVDRGADWPTNHIDWEAAAESLKQDYTPIELRGVTFWARA